MMSYMKDLSKVWRIFSDFLHQTEGAFGRFTTIDTLWLAVLLMMSLKSSLQP